MSDPFGDGLTLLVSQFAARSNWSLDFASLRPFVSRVLLVENGAGAYLLPSLVRTFPNVPVEHLLLPPHEASTDRTARVRRTLGATDGWVLVIRAGSNVYAARRFRVPAEDRPQAAIHLCSPHGEARWAPVLVPGRPGRLSVEASGEVVVDVAFQEAECNTGLLVDARNAPAPSTSVLARGPLPAADASRDDAPEKLLDNAQRYFRLGAYAEAEFWYRHCIRQDGDAPDRWLAHYRRALCLQAVHKPWPGVEAALAEAFDIDPDRAEPLYHIARHYRDAHEYAKAFELAGVGLEIDTPKTSGPFEYSVYHYELPLLYVSCAAALGADRDCIRVANQLLRRPGVPEEVREEAAEYRARSLSRIQPFYPLSIRRRNRILVVVPFRNAGGFLGRCVESLAGQDYENCRFVLIDDASTDGSLDGVDVSDPRFIVQRNETRRGVIRNQLNAVTRFCEPDDIVVYVDGDDRLVDDSALSYINEFFNSTRCWIMYGQYRDTNGRYGHCEPVVADPSDTRKAIDAMHFPMHIRAHRAGLIERLRRRDPELLRLRDDNGEFLDAVADMALMRVLIQLAGLSNVRYNDRILYEYNARNPESHYSAFALKRIQDRQADLVMAREPLEAVASCGRGSESGRSSTRVFFLALDGMSPRLMREWGAAGLLPTLHHLFQTGHVRDIETPRALGNDAFWISLATGSSPGELGYYYRVCWDPHLDRPRMYDFEKDLHSRPFWSQLADTDHEAAIIDFPEIRHCWGINGMEVSEWVVHARLSSPGFFPSGLEGDLVGRFGDDPTGGRTETMTPRNGDQFVKLRDQLMNGVGQKTRAAVHYLNRGGWDFFAVGYGQGHDIGHQFWHVHDPGHPRHRPVWLRRYGDPMLQIYQRIDEAVGQLVEAAGPEANIILVAGLQIEAKVSCNSDLDSVLAQIEAAEFQPAAADATSGAAEPHRFFAVPHNNLSGAIRVNLKGREAAGIVDPGADYDRTLDRIESCLRQVVNADTGESVVSEAIRLQEVYDGPRSDALPDLIVLWNRRSAIRRISSPWFEEIVLRPKALTETRSGDHICKAEMVANFELPFPPGEPVPVQSMAPWLLGLIESGTAPAQTDAAASSSRSRS